MKRLRTFEEWLRHPSAEDQVCENWFRRTVENVFDSKGAFDPSSEPEDVHVKIAKLIRARLILMEGDVIYVREGSDLHPLNEAAGLLAYYMHSDTKEAKQAIAVLETNFMGYFPITDNLVARDCILLQYQDGSERTIDLRTLEEVKPSLDPMVGWPEYGEHEVKEEHYGPLVSFFAETNAAIGDPFFLERMLMYPFMQPFREKSHVLVGGGGNGKSMFMGLVQRLYGEKAMTDAPQPSFRGHDPAVISYNFVGKRVVTFNDVGDPSAQFLEWMKRMITGNLEVKTPTGAWMSVPCKANFFMETNHEPQVLNLEAHRRRFVVRRFDPSFKLREHLSNEELDVLGDRGSVTAGDIVHYLLSIKSMVGDWTDFNL